MKAKSIFLPLVWKRKGKGGRKWDHSFRDIDSEEKGKGQVLNHFSVKEDGIMEKGWKRLGRK